MQSWLSLYRWVSTQNTLWFLSFGKPRIDERGGLAFWAEFEETFWTHRLELIFMLQDLSPILSSWCKRIFFSLVKLPESLASSIYGFCHFIDRYIDSKKEQLYWDIVSTWRALSWLASNCPSWISVECTVTCVLLLQRVLEQRVVAVLDKLLPKPSLTSPPPMEEGGYQQVNLCTSWIATYMQPLLFHLWR